MLINLASLVSTKKIQTNFFSKVRLVRMNGTKIKEEFFARHLWKQSIAVPDKGSEALVPFHNPSPWTLSEVNKTDTLLAKNRTQSCQSCGFQRDVSCSRPRKHKEPNTRKLFRGLEQLEADQCLRASPFEQMVYFHRTVFSLRRQLCPISQRPSPLSSDSASWEEHRNPTVDFESQTKLLMSGHSLLAHT